MKIIFLILFIIIVLVSVLFFLHLIAFEATAVILLGAIGAALTIGVLNEYTK